MSDLDTLLRAHDGLEESIPYEKFAMTMWLTINKPPKRVGLWRWLWPWIQKPPSGWRRSIARGHQHASDCVAKLKQFRAIATRYDKRAINFLAGIYLASIVIWLN